MGWSWVPIPSPDPVQTWTPSQRPRPDPAPAGPSPTAPTSGSLRTPPSGPAYLKLGVGGSAARPPPPDECPQVPERAGRGVPRAYGQGPFAGPRVGCVRGLTLLAQRSAPGTARAPLAWPVRKAALASSSPPRPIRPQIFPLVGRPGAAQQPASIGQAREDASLPLGHLNVRPDRDRSPRRAAKARHLPGPRLRWRSGPRGRPLPRSFEDVPGPFGPEQELEGLTPPPRIPAALSPSPPPLRRYSSLAPAVCQALLLSTSNCGPHTPRGGEFCHPRLQAGKQTQKSSHLL